MLDVQNFTAHRSILLRQFCRGSIHEGQVGQVGVILQYFKQKKGNIVCKKTQQKLQQNQKLSIAG
jgi:hypothetical protein